MKEEESVGADLRSSEVNTYVCIVSVRRTEMTFTCGLAKVADEWQRDGEMRGKMLQLYLLPNLPRI